MGGKGRGGGGGRHHALQMPSRPPPTSGHPLAIAKAISRWRFPPPPAIPSRARRACAREQTIPADIKGSMLMTRHKSSERASERRSLVKIGARSSHPTVREVIGRAAPPFAGCSIIQRQWTHPPSFAMNAFRAALTKTRRADV